MKKKLLIIIPIVILLVLGIIFVPKFFKKKPEPIKPYHSSETEYNLKLIKTVNHDAKGNYLISPYSIEIALNMLKEGTEGDSRSQIDAVLGERVINDVSTSKVKIANAVFFKDKYKPLIKEDFVNILKTKYSSEVLYDKFTSPKVINDWVNKHTDGMIPKILNNIDSQFVMGLANAIAIDVKWRHQFECDNTHSQEFTKSDKSKINVEMMHETYESNIAYFETTNAKGAILDYEEVEGKTLEFVGILPNTNPDDYINNLTIEELESINTNKIIGGEEVQVSIALPRFTYSYDLGSFKEVLQGMGITDVFDSTKANFNKVMDNSEIYVNTAIHKTRIELNETGTKAAAVTYFGTKDNAMPMLDKSYSIAFNRPFIYMIRDKATNEILFFGVVEEPNIWKGSTCNGKK